LLLFNTGMTGGAIVSQPFSQGSPGLVSAIYQAWSEIPTAAHGGWLDPNDRLLAGDFMGDGRGQLLFFNTDPDRVGGAMRMQKLIMEDEASGATKYRFETVYWKEWSALGSTYDGWLDPNDRILAGDFMARGRTQLLFFNTDASQIPGAIRIQELNAGGTAFVDLYTQDWSAIAPAAHGGWLEPNDRIVAGDFLKHGRAQLLFFNTDPDQVGGAIRMQEFVPSSNGFVTNYWQNWSAIAPAAHGGWLEPNDRIIAGQFFGNGRSQLLFFNTDPDHVGGAIRIQDFQPSSNTFETKYWQNWSATPSGMYGGWLDPSDLSLAIGSL
jgi:hypothetical protein